MSPRTAILQQQRPITAPASSGDPWRYWSAATIARISGCPLPAVRTNWPLIVAALQEFLIADRPVQMAAIGTIAIETASTFEPVREAFWMSEEWRRANLRYYPWYGRGFTQLTWEDNYRVYGELISEDLLSDPDRAMEPRIAARVMAAYFANHGGGPLIPAAARAGNLTEVRRLVQGGSDGLPRLVSIATALQAA